MTSIARYRLMASAYPCQHGWPAPDDCKGQPGLYLAHVYQSDITYAAEIAEYALKATSCFRCGNPSNQWFDGLGAENPRAICAKCEQADYKIIAHSLAAPQS